MVPGRWRLIRQISNGAAATCAAAAILVLCAAGYAGVPAIGHVLDPGHGAWASAAGGQLPRTQVLTLAGLGRTTVVSLDAHGLAAIEAGRLSDAMLALGYLHASFRLTQMDLQRRLAEGGLSELVGAGALASDRFELQLGLLRTARREWAAVPRTSTAAMMLVAYARGVNDYLAQLRGSGQWPAVFSVAGVYPARWTPVDSLAVQGYLAQQLDYTTTPLDYAVLASSLGIGRTMRWFPVSPSGAQHPYDPGPYRTLGIMPLSTGPPAVAGPTKTITGARHAHASGTGVAAASTAGQPRAAVARATATMASQPSAAVARAAASVLAATRDLPYGQAGSHWAAGSAWAMNGAKVAGGGTMLAGSAALPEPIASAWFQVAVSAPRYDVTGVSLPGLPGVIIGHNKHIAWTLASAQNQSTLFYIEKTSRSRPGDYFWRNHWQAMRKVHYAIPVRGGETQHLTVELTNHGPVLTRASPASETISVDWMGSGGSPDVAVLAGVGAAANFTQFRAALAGWHSPALTFGYADDRGNIGALTAGHFPVVRSGTPWLPLAGSGADDVAGMVPYAALPHSYDPPGHVIALAGQRPVTAAYPYYLGTSANVLDPGDRAGADYAVLARRSGIWPVDLVALQRRPASDLAGRLLPRLLAALRQASLTPVQRQATSVLRGWNHVMETTSAAAAIWWTFWSDYLSATFGPWWRAAAVPVRADPAGLRVSPGQVGLASALEHWTLADPSNFVFTPPGARVRTAAATMRAAFAAAVTELSAHLGGQPSSWALDRMSAATVTSPAQLPVLGYGRSAGASSPWMAESQSGAVAPYPGGQGDQGWRVIIRLRAGHGGIEAKGIYSGGQSENPASPWHGNLTARWRSGGYLQLTPAGTAAAGRIRWELLP
ncbi:MAG TPA: penicillin acylase family protein [Streptosporangiaceae bacterium]